MAEPKIRFKKADGGSYPEWIEYTVADVFDKVKDKNKNLENTNVITNSAEFGLVSQREFFDKDIAVEGKTNNYTIIKSGDFVYNPRKSTHAPMGPFNCYCLEEDGIVSPLYTCLRPKGVLNPDFLLWYFQTDKWHGYVNEHGAQNGARHDRVGMTDAIMMGIPITAPCYEEQQKIANVLDEVDSLIAASEKEITKLQELKKGCLQKMFPRNGADVPEIRFPEFSDDWEKHKLCELCERVTRKNKNGESDLPLTIASQYGLIDQRDFFNKVVAAKDMSNYYLLKKGEFAYNKSYSNGFDYGSIKRLNAYEQGCLSTLYICFRIISSDIESDYLECFFDTLNWYNDITMICSEGARNHGLLNVDIKAFFNEVTIQMPSSKDEQRKISAYLNDLDNLITIYQRECEKYRELKKGLLQQMFV